MVTMFLNGGGMRGGAVHSHIGGLATFLREVRTAPHFRFYSVRDEFPGIFLVERDGCAVAGELYAMGMDDLREHLLPVEPPELELSVVRLEDGSSSLSMVLREDYLTHPDVTDISAYGGWRAYRAARFAASS